LVLELEDENKSLSAALSQALLTLLANKSRTKPEGDEKGNAINEAEGEERPIW